MYYSPANEGEMEVFKQELRNCSNLTITSYRLESKVIPINKLKNLGIKAVATTHYLFAELNLVPSSSLSSFHSPAESLYQVLKATPGYLWRDPYFVGVVPVFEWTHDAYPEAVRNYQYKPCYFATRRNYHEYPATLSALQECLEHYRCRPLQTTTIPMVARKGGREA